MYCGLLRLSTKLVRMIIETNKISRVDELDQTFNWYAKSFQGNQTNTISRFTDLNMIKVWNIRFEKILGSGKGQANINQHPHNQQQEIIWKLTKKKQRQRLSRFNFFFFLINALYKLFFFPSTISPLDHGNFTLESHTFSDP